MGSYWGLVILVGAAMVLQTVHSQGSCNGRDGHPGQPGARGRDGWPGSKGERGEAPLSRSHDGNFQSLKGELGSQGEPGAPGPKGFSGDFGSPGEAGHPGARGPDSGASAAGPPLVSAFCVVRNANTYPVANTKITFQKAIVNRPEHFHLNSGTFTCRVSGVYYFVFHYLSKVNMCVTLKADTAAGFSLGFCDHNVSGNVQVLSGGVVLKLTQGEKVWLESILPTPPQDTEKKEMVFNGFLLFPR